MEQEKKAIESVKKVETDRPSDFMYHAAFIVYSKTWDENSSEEVRSKLNEIMSSLTGDEGGYPNFYGAISQYRKDQNPDFRPSRTIKTQRKRDWKKSEAKAARVSRYRK